MMGHNNPPPSLGAILEGLNPAMAAAKAIVDSGALLDDEADRRAGEVSDALKRGQSDLEKARKADKQPSLEEGRRIDRAYDPHKRGAANLIEALRLLIGPYRAAKAVRLEEEKRRKDAEAEAERQRAADLAAAAAETRRAETVANREAADAARQSRASGAPVFPTAASSPVKQSDSIAAAAGSAKVAAVQAKAGAGAANRALKDMRGMRWQTAWRWFDPAANAVPKDDDVEARRRCVALAAAHILASDPAAMEEFVKRWLSNAAWRTSVNEVTEAGRPEHRPRRPHHQGARGQMKPKPFVKWAGGKRRVAPEIVSRMPRDIGTYVEPFVGAGAVFLELLPKRALLVDVNGHLMSAWRGVQANPESVGAHLEAFEAAHCEDFYKHMRELSTSPNMGAKTIPWRAAWFIYLNKTCFNGLWRVNRSGAFNVPWNQREKCPKLFDADNLAAVHEAMRGVSTFRGDYASAPITRLDGCTIYCDPPYIGTWTGYTSNPWTQRNQDCFVGWCYGIRTRGARVVVSQPDTPEVRGMWEGWRLVPIAAPTSVSRSPEARGRRRELLCLSGEWEERGP